MYAVNVTNPAELPLVSGCRNSGDSHSHRVYFIAIWKELPRNICKTNYLKVTSRLSDASYLPQKESGEGTRKQTHRQTDITDTRLNEPRGANPINIIEVLGAFNTSVSVCLYHRLYS